MKVRAWKKYSDVLECWGPCTVEGTRWRLAWKGGGGGGKCCPQHLTEHLENMEGKRVSQDR